jgi:glutathione S-transferase
MMKLYFANGTCSLAPHVVLREAGLAFELEKVDLGKKVTSSGADYLTINPKGYVPALRLDDGQVLTEGPAMVQYIADQKPDAGLAPRAGTIERYRLQEWLNYISTELHKQYSPLFNKNMSDETKAMVREYLGKRIAFVAASLEGKQYLMGERFSVADPYLFTVLRWSKHVSIDLAQWPAIGPYMARVGERESVKAALDAERNLK